MEVGVRILGVILRLMDLLLWPLFWVAEARAPRRRLPAPRPVHLRGAADLARALRDGEMTSEELVSAYIERVQEVNEIINAVVDERFSAALVEAKEADRQIEEARGQGKIAELFERKPLLGVPFTVKESCSLAGMSNSVGCVEHAGRKATADGAAVRAVRAGGAVPLLVSNTPELCLGWETRNLLTGTTRNPHRPSRTPGGSSGGEVSHVSNTPELCLGWETRNLLTGTTRNPHRPSRTPGGSSGGEVSHVSNTPELCLGWETRNLLTGTTRNPHRPSRTPGGSSGGEVSHVSNTPELCLGWETRNLLTGTTRNPHRPSRTPGGSSGGEVSHVSNTPELCLGWETRNLLTGTTRNPHRPSRTPGGSSGGEVSHVSNTPELCLGWETRNLLTGTTRNPHRPSRTPGGSSGGEVSHVSNTPELCLGWETRNLLTGTTRNPHRPSRTPGGSSGGEVSHVSNTPELCLGWETRNLLTGTTRNPHRPSRTPGGSSGGEVSHVSNTPELCLGWETRNLLTGTTRNPHRPSRTPGGSSGGEAALLACGASVFGVASDIAGSIRLPAAFCGLYGHKPTPGIIPIEGHIPTLNDPQYPKFLTVGPMAKTAEDLPLLLNVMAGENRHKLRLDEPVDFNKLRVLYMTEAGRSVALQPVHRSIAGAVRDAARHLRRCGATLSEEKFEELEDSVELSISVFFSMKDIPNMLQDPTDPKKQRSLLVELLKHIFGGATRSLQALGFALVARTKLFIPEARRRRYCRKAEALRERITRTLGTDGVLIYPVFTAPAHRHGEVFPRAGGVLYSMLASVLGLPASAAPAGRWRGLPRAVQVIAAPGQDRLCVAVARQLERGLGGWTHPATGL